MTDYYIHHKIKKDHWYKEPWMLLVLGGPAIVVVAAFVTFYLAWHDSDKVVSKDYYTQGLNIDRDILKDAKAAEYKLAGEIQFAPTSGKLMLSLEGTIKFPDAIQLTISSNSHASEFETAQQVTLAQVKPGKFEGQLDTSSTNTQLWHIKIEATDWRLTDDWKSPLHGSLHSKAQN